MICLNPYIAPGLKAYGCGQCMPCRVNKRRVWSHRILLEAHTHAANSFVTLTYSDENLPEDGSLVPSHVTLFLKRLRKSLGPQKVRYFAVGEYGDQTERPHYHLALFGVSPCNRVISAPDRDGYCCPGCERLRTLWGLGITHVGELNSQSAGYIAGYVTKKLTKADDERLQGRHPEFARMSLRPGIGAGFLWDVADSFLRFDLEKSSADVPTALRHGARKFPLGRYLTRRLRTYVGRVEQAPEEVTAALDATVQELRASAEAVAPNGQKGWYFKQAVIDASLGRARQIEARQKRSNRRHL